MALVATAISAEPRSYSIGPVKEQILIYTALSGDTSGTVTAAALKEIFAIVVDGGMRHSAAPTFAGNVATLAFVDPSTGGLFGTIRVIGR